MGTQQPGEEVLEIITVIPTNCHLLRATSPMNHLPLHLQNFLQGSFLGFSEVASPGSRSSRNSSLCACSLLYPLRISSASLYY